MRQFTTLRVLRVALLSTIAAVILSNTNIACAASNPDKIPGNVTQNTATPATPAAIEVVLIETNAPLKASGTVASIDVMNPQTFAAQSIIGKYGTFNIDPAGAWSYSTSSALDELKAGQGVTDNFTVVSDDGTSTTVKITIDGTNDPAVLSAADVVLIETNSILKTGGKLTITDVDSLQTFVEQKKNGNYGTFNIDSSGVWSYVTASALDELKVGQGFIDKFTVASVDGTTTTVKITIDGTNDPAVLSAADVVLTETNEPLNASGKLTIKDVDSPETFVAQSKVAGTNGTFNIESSGAWTYVTKSALNELKAGQSASDIFAVSSSDGTETTVKVTINGTNDPAILSAADVVLIETDEPLNTSGKLTIKDVDSPETFVAQKKVGSYGTFNIDTSGAWTYAAKSALNELKVGEGVSDSFTISSADGTTITVKVTIDGTNDAAVLSFADIVLTETNEPLSASGKLTIKDIDSPETFVVQKKAGKYGTFNIDSTGGWFYVTKNALNELKQGQSVSDKFTVSSADGTTTTFNVTINGSNDPAILSPANIVLNVSNVPLSTGGKLTIKDIDSPETFVAQGKVGNYGIFNIDSAGAWTYVTNSALDELKEGQNVSDNFIVSSADGTTTTVRVVINNGPNVPAILSADQVVLVETNVPLKPHGNLTIKDPDDPETFVAQSNVAGANGVFNIDSKGAWTYVANSAFDYLNVGQSVSDKFTVASADGTTTTVKVSINGSNDPAILSSADISLDEINGPLSTSGILTIVDVDSPETFVPQSKVEGSYGTFSIDSAGVWTYVANSAFNYLNVDQFISDSFTVSSKDGTTTTVKVTINGTNDPAILSAADVLMTQSKETLRTNGTLTIKDLDSPETFVGQKKVGSYGTFNMDSTGAWTYVANSSFDYLKVGENISDKFTVSSADGTTTTVKVTINGSNDPAILSADEVVLTETNAPLKAHGKLTIKDIDSPETFVEQNNLLGSYGFFSIDTAGAWTYVTKNALNETAEGQSVTDSFTVSSADGTATTVKITIKGSNDPATLSAADVMLTETNEPLTTGGTLTITDVDSPETFLEQINVAGSNGVFNITALGTWTYVANSAFDYLNVGQSISDKFTVSSADGTTTTVKITITGSNDPAILSAADIELTETNEPLSTSGTLTIKDVDSPETFVPQAKVEGTYGTFNINSAGAWTYVTNSALDYLNVNQFVTESFAVSSADGTPTSVKVTVNGSNDPAILSADDIALTETNVPLRTNGTLTIRDVDSAETFVAQRMTLGTYGIFTINSVGAWAYVANSAFDYLKEGQTISDSFIVSSADGTTTTVKVAINGTNDPAVLSAADVVLYQTKNSLSTGGRLTIKDADSPQTFIALSNVAGTNGVFNIDSAGAWTYVTNSALDDLVVGRSAADIFTVSSADGTTTTVRVTIKGTSNPVKRK